MDILAVNETVATIVIATIIIMASLIPYVLHKKRQSARMEAMYREAQAVGRNRPLLQHPQFDLSKCVGCAVCTRVCPEGDVLGLIDGKVAIINGSRCIGIGECARECPVGGITIGLGDISTREDIPQLSEDKETNIPGIYIAGELGGMALIRNAVDQGTRVIDAILKKYSDNGGQIHIGIIGAGPAGLTAALRCVEKKIPYTIIDQQSAGGTILHYPRQKLTMVQPVNLPLFGKLDKGEYTKEELLDIWHNLIEKFGIDVKTGYHLQKISGRLNEFTIHTSVDEISCTHVILALGRRGTPRKLKVPGEELPKVMYKLLDAATYTNKNILVVGGGDSAVEAAIGLANQKGNKVTISYRKDGFFRIKKRNEDHLNDLLKRNELKVVFNSNVKEIKDDSVVLLTDSGDKTLANDFVFIFAGGLLPFKLMQDIGIKFGEKIEKKV